MLISVDVRVLEGDVMISSVEMLICLIFFFKQKTAYEI